MNVLTIFFIVWILANTGSDAVVNGTKEDGEHEMKKCIQAEDGEISFEDVKTDAIDLTSQWPPGPYAIPMARYGCPESSIYGWKESYILLTWQYPQEGYVHISPQSDAMPFETLVDTTNEPFYHLSDRHIYMSAKPYTYKYRFCMKHRSNESLDIGEWPDGKYSIYATKSGCPQGFETGTSNISLPNISRWESDGYIPAINIVNEDTEVVMQIQLCSRIAADNLTVGEDWNRNSSPVILNNTWTFFVLIKTENFSCPVFQHAFIQEETMYMKMSGLNGTDSLKMIANLCFYQRTLSLEDENHLTNKRLANAFFLHIDNITHGLSYKDTLPKDKSNTGSCNVDLGLGNFRINDVQISASSWMDEFPPMHARPHLSGWCASFDDERPYIMGDNAISDAKKVIQFLQDLLINNQTHFAKIEFMKATKIEGITLYNWEKKDVFNGEEGTKYVLFGAIVLTLTYDKNLNYNNKTISFDTSRTFTEPQTIWFADSIEANYIKLTIEKSATHTLNCMKFELQGCHSIDNYKLINTQSDIRSHLRYEGLCLIREIYKVGNILTSVDLPYRYESNQVYRWIIRLRDTFIKLVFTHISFKSLKNTLNEDYSACSDSLIISNTILDDGSGRVVDSDFRKIKYSMTVETSETRIVLTLKTCPITFFGDRGEGFKTFVMKQSLPACFSLHARVPLSQGQEEVCSQSTMVLTSMSYLGIPFSNTTERWTISVPMHRINLQIIEFYVTCQNGIVNSLFKIINMARERTYCNFNRPPDSINSSYDKLIVSFYKDIDLRTVQHFEGFKITYTAAWETMTQFIDYMEPYSKDTNIALNKPAIMIGSVDERYSVDFTANKGTDGITFPDLQSDSCFRTVNYPNDPSWWIVDLQAIYNIRYIVIYNSLSTDYDYNFHAMDVEVLTGISMYSMHVTGQFCGLLGSITTITQAGIKARYVRLNQAINVRRPLTLCEVMVFGELESRLLHTSLEQELEYPKPIDGQWGQWSTWEGVCYKKKQMRYRKCDRPRPDYFGRTCPGKDSSYRSCKPEEGAEDKTILVYPSHGNVFELYTVTTGYDKTADLSEKGYIPWLQIDLRTIHRIAQVDISYEVFSDVLENIAIHEQYFVISAGNTLCDIRVQNQLRLCGGQNEYEIIRMNGKRARYVKLTLIGVIIEELTMHIQKVYNESGWNSSSSCDDIKAVDGGMSIWSEWGNCSTNCGRGLSSRTRTCTSPKPVGSGMPCFGEKDQHRPCTGNGNCLVCSNTFGKCYSIISRLTNWHQASLECRRRSMKLVSVLSLQEMNFIKSILRERRYLEGNPTDFHDSDFYVHIGLFLEQDDRSPIWENELPVLFSAWKFRPSKPNCTRMNFKLFDEDRSWETEDCENKVAEYIMCEFQSGDRSIAKDPVTVHRIVEETMVHEQIPSWKYNGTKDIAISGRKCQHQLACPEKYSDCGPIYCRYTRLIGFLHCPTDYSLKDECSVKLPEDMNSNTVYYVYMGNVNTTFSGKTCQRWDKQSPHNHFIRGDKFKGEGISDAANFCRDPGNTGYVWCFTTDKDTRWEPCLLNEFIGKRQCTRNLKYNVSINVTVYGKPCLSWDKVQSYEHSKKFTSNAENYCRDPLNFGYYWCYVDSFHNDLVDIKIEPCQVEAYPLQGFHVENNFTRKIDNFFICNDGLIIPQHFACNGKFDCLDQSDETDCLHVYTTHPLIKPEIVIGYSDPPENGPLFQCNTNEWISLIARCDRVIDCLDASDEINCPHYFSEPSTCATDQFRCTNGDCIHISQVCNFRDDCIDASDEYCDFGLCLPTEYRCNSGQCISSNQRCDAIKQCIDGSDEIGCVSCQHDVAFHCDVAFCIQRRLTCDGYADCEDGSDEELCDEVIYTSCKELWEAGFRKSGKYVIAGVNVACEFDDVFKDGKMYTVIEFDLDSEMHSSVGLHWYLINRPLRIVDGQVFDILSAKYHNCTQQMRQMCYPQYEIAMSLDGRKSNCNCITIKFPATLDQNSELTDIEGCNVTSNVYYIESDSKKQSIYFRFHVISQFRYITLLPAPDYNLVFAGPSICEQDFKGTNFACKISRHVIPSKQRCVYDLDHSGFPIGCRDGSHLLNCEHYDCPLNTVHCPGSFCIAVRFVCDGELHCPGGEDEENCGCASSENEIIIIHEEGSPIGLDINAFARQFKSHTNIIRLLSYKASKPLLSYGIKRTLLEVRDIEINRKSSVENQFECRYKRMANELIRSVHFTNTGLKGVVLIQSSVTSEEVIKEMLENINITGHDFRIYIATESSKQLPVTYNQTTLPLVNDIHINRWKSFKAIGAEYFSDLCNLTVKVNCSNAYKCASSKMCIPMEQVCDGHIQCVHGDDETLCSFQCPANCTCAGFYSNCSAVDFELTSIPSIPQNTRHLDLSYNNNLSFVLQDAWLKTKLLSVLNISHCDIESISRHAFDNTRNLRLLDLSFNKLSRISEFVFGSLKKLTTLILRGNDNISVIETNAFDGLSQVQTLDFKNMKLKKILAGTFAGLNLTTVDLSNNRLIAIEDFAFSDSIIETINFEGNDIQHFTKEIFTGLIGLTTLRTSAFKFCCIRPNYVREENCYPLRDEFSSCEDLMRNPALQFLLWLIGVTALIGNFLTIVYRTQCDKKRLKLGFGIFTTNLAIADFLMGVYLIIIAIADAAFRKRYIYVSDYWKNSAWCNLAGILSTMSSEASVLFLCLITLDRILIIKYPFGDVRITKEKAIACTAFTWLFAVTIAVFPVTYEHYFKNMFYSRSGVCIALPLTRDRPPGWMYSLTLFVGLNFITFIMVAFGQLSIFFGMKQSTGIATTAEAARKRDLKVARNLLLVVATDFLCWFPIGVMGIMALSGYVISGDIYAWAAVFILPINSALNPILYTLTAIIADKKFRPSTKDQSVKQITKETGESVLTFYTISSRITQTELPASKYSTQEEVTTPDIDIPLSAVLTISAQLAQVLHACHCCSLGLKHFDKKSIYLRRRNKQLTGAVKIKGEMFISFEPEDKANDIYELGMFLRGLIHIKKKKC